MNSGDLPPTNKQLRFLRELAVRAGQSFAVPRNRSEASAEIRRLKKVRATGFTFAELTADQAGREADSDAAIVQPWEIAGRGSSATWSQRS